MTIIKDQQLNASDEQILDKSYLAPASSLSSETAATELDRDSSQYPNPGQYGEFANENKAHPLLGRFQFRHEPDLPRSHATVDLFLVLLSFAAVHYFYLGSLNLTTQRSVALISALVLLALSLNLGGLYSTKKLRRLNVELTTLTGCWVFAFAAIGLFAFLSKISVDVSRVWMTLSMILILILLTGVRIIGSLGFMARTKANGRNIVVLKNASDISPLFEDLRKQAGTQIKIVKVFSIPSDSTKTEKYSESLNDSAKQLNSFIENQRQCGAAIEQVWIAVEGNQPQVLDKISETLINSSVDVCVVPDRYTERLLKGDVTRFGDTDVVNVSEVSLSLAADQFKRVFDFLVASIALLFLSIPMVAIAVLIKLESKGPVLFRQKRYGLDGREIEILKFRSMFIHSDSEVQQAVRNDDRITRVGKFIRKTSLDELPQLINVLNGTMSLVGPRPHAVAHNELWRRQIQGYMLRHKVRPGITGLAQVHGWRGETNTVYKMQQRVKYDLEYIKAWSPWLDLKILMLTIFVGFVHKNAY